MTTQATAAPYANPRFANALRRQPQATPPIWLMRQAGRYHQHYQNLRRQHTFLDLCREPELAAQTALGPVLDFGFDVAILFSDLLFPLDALGLELSYPDTGPHLGRKLNAETIKTLRPLEEAWPALEFQGAAVRATREVLPRDCSLIGFVGGPWTLFGYAVEGSHRGTLAPTKRLLPLFGEFCRHLMPLLKRNIAHQLANGAELVLVIDTAAGELPAAMFAEIVTPHLAEIASAFSGQVGYYAKGAQPAHFRSPLFTGGDFAGVGVDYRWDLREAFLLLNGGFVQGNFDPALLTTDAATLEKRLRRYLEPLREVDRAGWVCGLGHGVLPETPPDNVRRFVEIAREVLR